MSRRRAVFVLAGVTAAVAGAMVGAVILVLDRNLSRAPAVPPGPLVVANASFAPRIHLFGDVVEARVDVEADRERVDTGSIRLHAPTDPYVQVGRARVSRTARGRVERLRYSLRLVCLRPSCALSTPTSPRDNAPTQRTFTLPPATVSFRSNSAKTDTRISASWPALVVATRIASARPNDYAFTADLAVPEPSYGADPGLLVALLTVIGLALVLVPPAVALRGVPGRLLRGAPRPRLGPRELALYLLEWAAARDVADRRRALERVALELGGEHDPALAERSRVAAWSRPDPDAEVTGALRDELHAGGNGSRT